MYTYIEREGEKQIDQGITLSTNNIAAACAVDRQLCEIKLLPSIPFAVCRSPLASLGASADSFGLSFRSHWAA